MIGIVGVHEGLNPAESTIAWHQHYMWPPTPYRCPSDRSIEQEEPHDEIAFRLSNYHFAMSSRHAIPLVRCFERKDTYKAWGATYNADAKQWYFPPGTDLRGLLRYQPSWLQNPELLRREILMRMISEIEHNPTLVR